MAHTLAEFLSDSPPFEALSEQYCSQSIAQRRFSLHSGSLGLRRIACWRINLILGFWIRTRLQRSERLATV